MGPLGRRRRLSPLERAAFLLHDVFDLSFSEVASALQRSYPATPELCATAVARPLSAPPSVGRKSEAAFVRMVFLRVGFAAESRIGPTLDCAGTGRSAMLR